MEQVTEIQVNGERLAVDAAGEERLLDVLRDDLGLMGCKIGCGEGECGVCTVLVDEQAVRSCMTPVGSVGGRDVRTIEGLAASGRLHPLQQAFLDAGAFQCGYCTPGMIMSALGLLQQCPDPSEETILQAMHGNICRCGAYTRIVHAIRQAAARMRTDEVDR